MVEDAAVGSWSGASCGGVVAGGSWLVDWVAVRCGFCGVVVVVGCVGVVCCGGAGVAVPKGPGWT